LIGTPARGGVSRGAGRNYLKVLRTGPGKTRAITRPSGPARWWSRLWATWCQLSRSSPKSRSSSKRRPDRRKTFVVVALRQDDNPAEGSQLRTIVEENAIGKARSSVRLAGGLGRATRAVVGGAFDARGIPHAGDCRRKGSRTVVHVGRSEIQRCRSTSNLPGDRHASDGRLDRADESRSSRLEKGVRI